MGEADARAGSGIVAGKEAQPDKKLKADLLQLVADAKAGKAGTTMPRRYQPPQSNNLSKGKKIAIGVGIAAAVTIIIIVAIRPRATGPGRVL